MVWRTLSLFRRKLATPSNCRRCISGLFSVHPEVADAVASGEPVVALETTIVTHGMPHPQNIDTALEVEAVVRSAGAVPASIGVLDGTVHVGLTAGQLEALATSPVQKISQRDLAYCISKGQSGGTTVAGTMLCAHKAGIPVFVTGGIGGVHRDGENTLDVSADLMALSKVPVAVVCAGVKSILDIGRTLEYLETQGVPVLTFGQERAFPSFFTADSGHKAPHNVASYLEAARVIDTSLEFGVGGGVVFGVCPPSSPSPAPGWSGGKIEDAPGTGWSGGQIEDAIQRALQEARDQHITGKEITPFVLQRVNKLTEGQSLRANIALIKNNAHVGGSIAVQLSQLRKERKKKKLVARSGASRNVSTKDQVVVIGASNFDFTAKINSPQILEEGTNAGSLSASFGGVGRNIAECMSRLGNTPLFISAVGKDQTGKMMTDNLMKCGLSLAGIRESEIFPTAAYCLVLNDKGEVHCGIGDMDIATQISVDWVNRFQAELMEASYVCIDGNLPEDTIEYVLSLCSNNNIPVWYEPTCVLKARKPFQLNCQQHISITSPNLLELRNMHHCLTAEEMSMYKAPSDLSLEDKVSECRRLLKPIMSHIPTVVVSLGSDGVLYCTREEGTNQQVECLHYPAAAEHMLPVKVLSVSGAGDSFVGSMLTGISRGLSCDLSIKVGLNAAYLSLHSATAISSSLTPQLLQEEHIRKWATWDYKPVSMLF